jgi:hypothetical protein
MDKNKHTVTIIPLDAIAQVFASHMKNIDAIFYTVNGMQNTMNSDYGRAVEKYKEALANLFITKYLIPALNNVSLNQKQEQAVSDG